MTRRYSVFAIMFIFVFMNVTPFVPLPPEEKEAEYVELRIHENGSYTKYLGVVNGSNTYVWNSGAWWHYLTIIGKTIKEIDPLTNETKAEFTSWEIDGEDKDSWIASAVDYTQTATEEDGYVAKLSAGGYDRNETRPWLFSGPNANGVKTYRSYIEWNVSAIPDIAEVSNINFTYHCGYDRPNRYTDIYAMQFQPTSLSKSGAGNNQTIYEDAGNGTLYKDGSVSPYFVPSAGTGKTTTLGSGSHNDLENHLINDWWCIGYRMDDESSDIAHRYEWVYSEDYGSVNPNPRITVTYVIPDIYLTLYTNTEDVYFMLNGTITDPDDYEFYATNGTEVSIDGSTTEIVELMTVVNRTAQTTFLNFTQTTNSSSYTTNPIYYDIVTYNHNATIWVYYEAYGYEVIDYYDGFENGDFEEGETVWFFSGTSRVQSDTVYEGINASELQAPNDWIKQPYSGVWNDGTGGIVDTAIFDFYGRHDGAGNHNVSVIVDYHDETFGTYNYSLTSSWAQYDVMNDLNLSKGVYSFRFQSPTGSTVDFFIDAVRFFTSIDLETDHPSSSSANSSVGQTFISPSFPSYTLTNATFQLKRVGSPIGNVTARLYETENALPTGSALISSENLNVSEISTGGSEYTLDFTIYNFNFTASTEYFIALEINGSPVNSTNKIVAFTSGELEHSGNMSVYLNSDWSLDSVSDLAFVVYGFSFEVPAFNWLSIAFLLGVGLIGAFAIAVLWDRN